MGLLSRASNLDEIEIKQGLAFSDFVTRYSLKKCAVLELHDSHYCISSSVGFDALSILCSNSTSDFWDGICKNQKEIYRFEGNELSPLIQLFSDKLKDELKVIFVYKNCSSKILLSLNQISEECAEAFEEINNELHSTNVMSLNPYIKENSVVLKFSLDFSEAIEIFLTSEIKDNSSLSELYGNAILNEIYNRFVCFYNCPDATVKNGKYLLKTIFITGKAYSVELITNHIILNFMEVLGNYAELVQVDYCETATSCEQIQNFLQAE